MSRLVVTLTMGLLCGMSMAQGPIASHAPTVPATVGGAAPTTVVVARVNGVALTQADLDQQETAIFPYFRMHGGRIPPGAEPEIRSMAMQRIVLDELLYQEARRRNLKLPEARFQKGLRELRESFSSPKAYEEAVTKKYGSDSAFEQRMRRTLLARELWEAEVTRKSVVTPAEVRAYYENNKARFVRPEAISIQSISVMFPQGATDKQKEDARKRAEELLLRARATKNYEEFGVLAEQVSEDPWRVMMGDHNWVHRGEVDSQFNVIFSMKPAETTGVVESKEGFHILRVNDRQPQRQMTFTEMRDRLAKELGTKRRQERAEKFEQSLRKNAKIEM